MDPSYAFLSFLNLSCCFLELDRHSIRQGTVSIDILSVCTLHSNTGFRFVC